MSIKVQKAIGKNHLLIRPVAYAQRSGKINTQSRIRNLAATTLSCIDHSWSLFENLSPNGLATVVAGCLSRPSGKHSCTLLPWVKILVPIRHSHLDWCRAHLSRYTELRQAERTVRYPERIEVE